VDETKVTDFIQTGFLKNMAPKGKEHVKY